jgi:DNA-binding LytR/AlgR family response regulator
MMRFVLCDDNENFLTKLASIIENIFIKLNIDAEISKLIMSPNELLDYVENNDIDVILLDIKLNSTLSGIDVAYKIREKNKKIYIVFLTGHFEYSMLAYKVKTFDYLLKPISFQKLEETILRLYEDIYHEQSKLMSLCNGKYLFKEQDILYIEKNRTKAIIHTNSSNVELYSTLKKIQNNLSDIFIRCHKSYVINSEKISRIDNTKNIFYIGSTPIFYSKNFVNLERMIDKSGRDHN